MIRPQRSAGPRLALLIVALVGVLFGSQLVAAPRASAATGSIYGHISPPPGLTQADLSGMSVLAYGVTRARTQLASTGDFALTDLPLGWYRVVLERRDYVADTYWPGVPGANNAGLLNVGETAVQVDFTAIAGGIINGQITGMTLGADVHYQVILVGGISPTASRDANAGLDGSFRITGLVPGRYDVYLLTSIGPDRRHRPPSRLPDPVVVALSDNSLSIPSPSIGVHHITYSFPAGTLCQVAEYVPGPRPKSAPIGNQEPLPNGFGYSAIDEILDSQTVPCGAGTFSYTAFADERFQVQLIGYSTSWLGSPDNTKVHAPVLTGPGVHNYSGMVGTPSTVLAPWLHGQAYLVDEDGVAHQGVDGFKEVRAGVYRLYVTTFGQPGDPAPYFYPNLPEDLGVPPVSIRVGWGQTITLPKPAAAPPVGGVVKARFYPRGGTIGWAPPLFANIWLSSPDGSLMRKLGFVQNDGTVTIGGLATGRYLLGMTPSATARATGTKLTSATAYVPVDVVRGRTTDLGAVNAAVRPFTDVPKGSAFQWQIDWFRLRGFTTGYADGSFHPNETVSREAMAAFFYRAAGSSAYAAPVRSPFVDVPRGAPFYKEICWLAAKGISTGWVAANGTRTYRPKQAITREAMAAFMYRAAGRPRVQAPQFVYWFFDIGWWAGPFSQEINWMYENLISAGLPQPDPQRPLYHPTYPMTRALLADFFYNWKAGYNYTGTGR